MLLHLIDGTSGDPVRDYKTIQNELSKYGGGLAEKPQVVVLNKMDTLDEEERAFVKNLSPMLVGHADVWRDWRWDNRCSSCPSCSDR